jgi:hypothetical protein
MMRRGARALACALALLVLSFGRIPTARAEGGNLEAKQADPAPLQRWARPAPAFNTSEFIFVCATNHHRLM